MSIKHSNIIFQKQGRIPHNFKDLSNKVFGRLTVIEFVGYTKSNRKSVWLCNCECGKQTYANCYGLVSGKTQSCGCYNREVTSELFTTHGESSHQDPTPEIRAFTTAKQRCNNPNDHAYDRYGGRGIEFRFNSFVEFLNELGRKPTAKHSLDRINVNGHYEKGNVRWATSTEQARNKRNNVFHTSGNQTKMLCEWAEQLNVKPSVIQARITYHRWCVPCAVSLPVNSICPHKINRKSWDSRRANLLLKQKT